MKRVSLSSSGDLFESMISICSEKSSKSSHLRRFKHALTFAIFADDDSFCKYIYVVILKEDDS